MPSRSGVLWKQLLSLPIHSWWGPSLTHPILWIHTLHPQLNQLQEDWQTVLMLRKIALGSARRGKMQITISCIDLGILGTVLNFFCGRWPNFILYNIATFQPNFSWIFPFFLSSIFPSKKEWLPEEPLFSCTFFVRQSPTVVPSNSIFPLTANFIQQNQDDTARLLALLLF